MVKKLCLAKDDDKTQHLEEPFTPYGSKPRTACGLAAAFIEGEAFQSVQRRAEIDCLRCQEAFQKLRLLR